MKRLLDRINMRNLVIIALCITVIVMAIGYAVLSIKLNKDDPYYKVSFTKVEQTSSVKGGTTNPEGKFKINSSGQKVDFKFSLNNPYDELIYKITIKNEGNIPIEIKDIIEYPEYTINSEAKKSIEPVKIFYNDVTENVLEPDGETEINLVIQFNSGLAQKKNIDYSLILITSSPKNQE